MKKILVLCAFTFSLILAPEASLAQEKHLDVPYVPTKYEVVDEMLRMAGVGKNDVLYDLGCGDGRIVITAAKRFGCRGVGVDIDPERIAESKVNAAEAGVERLVRFIEGDLFEAEFCEASVVSLYLLSSVNLKLRPKLLRELKPGARVVSHNYGMDSWKPDDSSVVTVDDIPHDVYFWVIPANVTGEWEMSMSSGRGKSASVMEIEQNFQWANGSVATAGNKAGLKDFKIIGEQIRFALDLFIGGRTVPAQFEGSANGNSMEGSYKLRLGGKEEIGTWKARRNPATAKPLDTEAGGRDY